MANTCEGVRDTRHPDQGCNVNYMLWYHEECSGLKAPLAWERQALDTRLSCYVADLKMVAYNI